METSIYNISRIAEQKEISDIARKVKKINFANITLIWENALINLNGITVSLYTAMTSH